MKSMTGFGRSSSHKSSPAKKPTGRARASGAKSSESTSAVAVDVAIKSVNGRFLEIRFHLPREYADLEAVFKSQLSKTFARGTVDVYINRSRKMSAPTVTVNSHLAKAWVESYRELGKTLKIKGEPTLEILSQVPELFVVDSSSTVSSEESEQVKALVAAAAKACDQERLREGDALKSELLNLCVQLEKLADEAQTLKAEANTELERRLKDRLHEQFEKRSIEGKVDDQRIAHEVVMLLDRADISEELARLKEHLKAYRTLLKSGEPQGKKLDFYAQELLREVNTIGSKSHIAKLTHIVVEAKTLIEKIREQVQNVE